MTFSFFIKHFQTREGNESVKFLNVCKFRLFHSSGRYLQLRDVRNVSYTYASSSWTRYFQWDFDQGMGLPVFCKVHLAVVKPCQNRFCPVTCSSVLYECSNYAHFKWLLEKSNTKAPNACSYSCSTFFGKNTKFSTPW